MTEYEALRLVQEALANWRDCIEPLIESKPEIRNLEEVKYCIVDVALNDTD